MPTERRERLIAELPILYVPGDWFSSIGHIQIVGRFTLEDTRLAKQLLNVHNGIHLPQSSCTLLKNASQNDLGEER